MSNIGFICRDDYLERLSNLSDQEVGRLVRALIKYHATGEMPDLKGRESAAFSFIKYDIDTSKSNYGKKRDNGTPKNTQEHQGTPKNTTKITISSTSTSTSVTDTVTRFDTFWAAYPKKTGKGKARESFDKLKVTDELLQTMLKALAWQKDSEQWHRDGGQYIPYPATWLNQKRWEDEPTVVKPLFAHNVWDALLKEDGNGQD
jgi:hypothetical protein